MKLNKFLSHIIMSIFVFINSSVFAAPLSTIIDMPKGWSEPAVIKAVENDILSSKNDLIRPMAALTRAELAEGITNVFGVTKKADISNYTDVPESEWYYESMQKAVAMGIINGYGNGLIKPEEKVTREEMFTIIYRALELKEGNIEVLRKFNDNELVSDWAEKAVAKMVENNFVKGNLEGSLKPRASITREEFAQVFMNIFAEYYNLSGTYKNVPAGNIIINTPDVVLKNTTVTGDLIIADGVGTGKVTLDNVKVLGRTLVRGGGENAVKLINNTVINGKLIVNNKIGKVRIYNSKSTIKNIELNTATKLEGNFENVEVKQVTEIETKGNITKLVLNAKTDVKVTSGKIKQVQIKDTAQNTTISGNGKVEKVNVNANDVRITTSKSIVYVSDGIYGVIAGKVTVKPGQTVVVNSSLDGSGNDSRNDSSKKDLSNENTTIDQNNTATINICKICSKVDCTIKHVFCNNCNKYDCGKTHKTCNICSKVDCTKKHVFCNNCNKYDCGKTHKTCNICSKVDCTIKHVFCERCNKHDCGKTHLVGYTQAQAKTEISKIIGFSENDIKFQSTAVTIMNSYKIKDQKKITSVCNVLMKTYYVDENKNEQYYYAAKKSVDYLVSEWIIHNDIYEDLNGLEKLYPKLASYRKSAKDVTLDFGDDPRAVMVTLIEKRVKNPNNFNTFKELVKLVL